LLGSVAIFYSPLKIVRGHREVPPSRFRPLWIGRAGISVYLQRVFARVPSLGCTRVNPAF
jgi:hypothetical protein